MELPPQQTPIQLLSRPYSTNKNGEAAHVTTFEIIFMLGLLIILIIMAAWVMFVLIEFVHKLCKGHLWEGDGKKWVEVEGRRYRQDMLMGGVHGVHREARRGIVERLAGLGYGIGGAAGGSKLGKDDLERGRTSVVEVERGCDSGAVAPRKRSVD